MDVVRGDLIACDPNTTSEKVIEMETKTPTFGISFYGYCVVAVLGFMSLFFPEEFSPIWMLALGVISSLASCFERDRDWLRGIGAVILCLLAWLTLIFHLDGNPARERFLIMTLIVLEGIAIISLLRRTGELSDEMEAQVDEQAGLQEEGEEADYYEQQSVAVEPKETLQEVACNRTEDSGYERLEVESEEHLESISTASSQTSIQETKSEQVKTGNDSSGTKVVLAIVLGMVGAMIGAMFVMASDGVIGEFVPAKSKTCIDIPLVVIGNIIGGILHEFARFFLSVLYIGIGGMTGVFLGLWIGLAAKSNQSINRVDN